MEDIMTVPEELADLLKEACRQVDAWQPWQRSRDPQGFETDEVFEQPLQSQSQSNAQSHKLQV
jgi:hypothetical protein